MIYEDNIDIRTLNNLKRHLLDSKKVEGNLLSIEEYENVKDKIFKGQKHKIEPLLLEEIKFNDNQIDLGKLVEIIDICNHFPLKVKKIKNKSNDIYVVLSSNTRENYDVKASSKGQIQDDNLMNNLEIIWGTINQRFKKLAHAFRFFDMDDNKTIEFIEFFSGLDKLRIKMSDADAL